MAQQVSKLSVLLMFDTSQFEKSLDQSQKKMMRAGRAMQEIGKNFSIGVSLPLAIIGKRVTETATAFEYQMARVSAISGATSSDFAELGENAEKLGASTIFTAKEVGQLSEEFAKLGFTAQEIVKVTESTLSLAQVTGASLPRAAEIAGATLRTFGLEADQVGQVNDVVAVAISRSALDFESFAETMKYAGSQAAISGISMEELGAAMGVLANRGVKGSIAGTRLRMIFAKLAEEGGNVHDNFLNLINSNISMTEAIDRFGVRAATAIPVLQENREEFFELEKQMRESSGALAIMQETMDDTSFAAQKKLKSALEDVSIQMGKALLPIVNALAGFLTRVANGFAALPTFVQTLIVSFGALAAAFGPLLFGLGRLMTMMPALTTMFPRLAAAISTATGPVGLIIAAVAALGFAIAGSLKGGNDFADLQERTGRATKRASEEAIKATSKIETLIHAYDNENRSLEEKQKILNQLGQLQPDYFGGLDAESTKVDDLKTKYDELFKAMTKQNLARAYMEEINRLQSERVQALIDQDKATRDLAAAQKVIRDDEDRARSGETVTGGFAVGMGGSTLTMTELAAPGLAQGRIDEAQDIIDGVEDQIEQINRLMEEDGLDELLSGLFGGGGGGGGGGGSTVAPADFSKDLSDVEKTMNKLGSAMAKTAVRTDVLGLSLGEVAKEDLKNMNTALGGLINAAAGGEDAAAEIEMVSKEMERLQEIVNAVAEDEAINKILDKLTDAISSSMMGEQSKELTPLEAARSQMKATKKALDDLSSNYPEQALGIQMLTNSYEELVQTVGKLEEAEAKANLQRAIAEKSNMAIINTSLQIGEALGAIGDSSKDAGQAMLQAASGALQALITQIYLLYAQKVMADGTTPSVIAKLALLGVGAGVIAGFIGSIPKLAKGGIAVGPQLAMVGDNRSGREAIIPLEKLPALVSKMGGGGSTRVYGNLRGSDLVVSSERGGRMQQRITR